MRYARLSASPVQWVAKTTLRRGSRDRHGRSRSVTFGRSSGTVRPNNHALRRRTWPQRNQIRPAGSGIQAAKFACGLRAEDEIRIDRVFRVAKTPPGIAETECPSSEFLGQRAR